MSDLVERLSKGEHPVSAVRYKTAEEFAEVVDRGFVLVKFTETKGGTELGFKIDEAKSNTNPDSNGMIRLVGSLTLDYVPVECSVDIDPQTLNGTGVLIPADGAGEASAETPKPSEAPGSKRKAKKKKKKAAKKAAKKSAKKSAKKAGKTAT